MKTPALTREKPTLVADADTPRDEWLRLRRVGITATDIPVIMNCSPWDSSFRRWHVKAGNITDDVEQNQHMLWGTLKEPVIADYFAGQHTEYHMRPGGLYAHGGFEWMLCSPDRLLHPAAEVTEITNFDGEVLRRDATSPQPNALLEIKSTNRRDGWGPSGSELVPVHVFQQVMWQLAVMGADYAHVAVLIGASDYREYTIHRDDEIIGELFEAARQFLRSIEVGQPPSIDETPATSDALRDLYDTVEPTEVEIDPDVADTYQTALQRMREARDLKSYAENAIRDQLRDGKTATCHGAKIATRSVYKTEGQWIWRGPQEINRLSPAGKKQ